MTLFSLSCHVSEFIFFTLHSSGCTKKQTNKLFFIGVLDICPLAVIKYMSQHVTLSQVQGEPESKAEIKVHISPNSLQHMMDAHLSLLYLNPNSCGDRVHLT